MVDDTLLLSAIRTARRAPVGDAGHVLDSLTEKTGLGVAQIDIALRKLSDIAALDTTQNPVADWSALSLEQARALGCVPFRLSPDGELRWALADPWDDDIVQQLASNIGGWPRLAAATSDLMRKHLGAGPMALEQMADADANAVVEFVDRAVQQACDAGASDVHFECDRAGVTVKLRLDGVMHTLTRHEGEKRVREVISRIKVMAQLDITESRMPQDGRVHWQSGQHSVDLRVSIMPSLHGEDAVLRLLDRGQLRSRSKAISLNLLGFEPVDAERIRALANLPHGMLLVTGPTGSGKTTTVYATLSEINTGVEKIITIEDPVEYELPGVLQIPVNERKGLSFAKGLRSILRHDPDRILVGEIRDAETAEIAVQSALTGHLVFTTVHANSMHDVTGRFRHFGLDMFGFMSALNGVVVQRLVRRLCPHCTARRVASETELNWLRTMELSLTDLPVARGCDKCSGRGYSGRGVIAEVHAVDDELRDLVTSQAPVSVLKHHIDTDTVPSLKRRGLRWVEQGLTSLEEVRRVVGWL